MTDSTLASPSWGPTLQLKQAESALRRHLAAELDASGITFEQWQVMAALLIEPGLRMTDLAERAVLPAASLTRHVDKLTQLALLIRRIDPQDKRRVAVALSARGRQVAERLAAAEAQLAVSSPALQTAG